MVKLDELKEGSKVKIVNLNKIRNGYITWNNKDIVEVKEVELDEGRIDVWDKDKFLSELIYENEFEGIYKIKD